MFSLQRLLPVCGLLLASSSVFATTILVSTPTPIVSSGTPVIVRIGFSNLGDPVPQPLGAYDIILNYDPSLLILTNITHGDPVYGNQLDLSGYGALSYDDTSSPGQVRMMEISLDDPITLENTQRHHFGIANLLFDTQGSGVSNLTLEVNSLGDANGFSIDAQTVGGSLTVGQSGVPEPAMFVLVGGGLAAFGLLRRSRANRD
ncbi:MAG: PEP-CTERM sorting domain-containing protein [Bryobacteraceae bacterium]